MTRAPAQLACDALTSGYGARTVLRDLSVELTAGGFTVIVGPNACGKSTLLKTMARLLRPDSGAALLDGGDIHSMPTKRLARRMGILPQSPLIPEGVSVADLVSRGRQPHQSWWQQWSPVDEKAVAAAMRLAGVQELSHRPVDALSGGQRQRVWIAMTLAQDTDVLLLDEPTTYLDLAHQVEVLDLLRRLNREEGRTIVAVLHDINEACRYADQLVAMREGDVVARGTPAEVMTAELMTRVFGLRCVVTDCPVTGKPLVIPIEATPAFQETEGEG